MLRWRRRPLTSVDVRPKRQIVNAKSIASGRRRATGHGHPGFWVLPMQAQLDNPERIHDNSRSRVRSRRQPPARHRISAAPAHRLGTSPGVFCRCPRVRPLYRASDLRSRPRRLPSPRRSLHLHVTPLLLWAPEHEPSVHLPSLCRPALCPLATDVLHCRRGPKRVDAVQPRRARRPARPLPASRQARSQPRLRVASRPGAQPSRAVCSIPCSSRLALVR